MNDIPESINALRVTASNTGRPVKVSVMNEFRC